MTPLDFLLLANIVVISSIAIWQGRRISALEARCADKTHLKLLAEAFRLRATALTRRQDEVDAAHTEFIEAFPARMKEYVPRSAYVKLENSFDERVNNLIQQAAVTPLNRAERMCGRCHRMVARWADHVGTPICANCDYKPENK